MRRSTEAQSGSDLPLTYQGMGCPVVSGNRAVLQTDVLLPLPSKQHIPDQSATTVTGRLTYLHTVIMSKQQIMLRPQ